MKFSDPVKARLMKVRERMVEVSTMKTGPRDSDLAIAGAVINFMPYTRPEDRTVTSFYAAQRKLKDITHFTGIDSFDRLDEQRGQLIRYIEGLIEIENSGNKGSRHTLHIEPPVKEEVGATNASLIGKRIEQELWYGLNLRCELAIMPKSFGDNLLNFLDTCRVRRTR
jgi:hypothetical protein